MRQTIFILMLLIGSTTVQAQSHKDTRLKEIRAAYAKAKEKIARNGKNGQSPKDMQIILNQLEDEEIVLYDMDEINYYFDETTEDNVEKKHPYFIVENWSNHGHTRYREVLIEPKSQQVIFCYMKGETDAGFVVESRYYYDANGACVEQKHNTDNSWTTEESEKKDAEFYLKIFNWINYNGYFVPLEPDCPQKPTTPKAERMKHIRATYAQAKEKVARNTQGDMPNELRITLHDRGDNWPPRTAVTNIYFEKKGEPTFKNDNPYCCYLITRHDSAMNMDGYAEYLFAPTTHDLIFSYTKGSEEGETHEWRYYYDENGQCIETKSNSEETDDGFYDKRTARDLLHIFKTLINGEDEDL